MKRNMLGFYLLISCGCFLILGNCFGVVHGNVFPTQGHDEGIPHKQIDSITEVKVQKNYGKLPLYFIQNDGQMDEKVRFYESGSGHAMFFTKRGVHLSLVDVRSQGSGDGGSAGLHPRQEAGWHGQTGLSVSLANPQLEILNPQTRNSKPELSARNSPHKTPQRIELHPLGANNNPEIIAEGLQEGKVNYFIGNDPKKWKSNIPTYKAVVYKGIYNNIDMKFYGNNRQMEYDIVVKPGASPSRIQLAYHDIEGLCVTEGGDLEISLKDGKIIQKRPYVYQEIDGKRVERDGKFRVLGSELGIPPQNPKSKVRNRKCIYGFQVASYDKRYPLVIDPTLEYSTYLGGSATEYCWGIAVDGSGNAYVAGYTASTDFPTASPYDGSFNGTDDVFVTKLDASGSGLVYSTYLGGSSYDYGYGIAVDSSGNAYVSGSTGSTNFPIVSAYQGSNAGGPDVFVTKISSTGDALIYSTYLGGSSNDIGYLVAVDGSGNAYVTGITLSPDFPTENAIDESFNGGIVYGDGFVTKIDASGTNLSYSTYLGGSSDDVSNGIAVDSFGNAYVAGLTTSTDFPTASPYQGTNAGGYDGFVTKISPTGGALIYSTYLGGSAYENSEEIAVDGSGNAYVTGWTTSTDFPTVSAYQGSNAGGDDVYVTKISASGGALVYSTYLGGSANDQGIGIAVDGLGNAYVSGRTASTDFPTACAYQASHAGGYYDAFVTKISPTGDILIYSTYLGGGASDEGWGMDVDGFGNAYVAGITQSVSFPTVSAYQGSKQGVQDVFVTKFAPEALVYDPNLGTLPSAQGWVHWSNNLPESNYTLDTTTPGNFALIQGSTAPDDNYQAYKSSNVCFNFAEDEVTLVAQLQVFSSGLTHIPDPQGLGSNRAGWDILVIDEVGRSVNLYIGESGLFILGENQFSSGLVAFDSTDGFHLYKFVINSSGASLFIDGDTTARAFLDFSKFRVITNSGFSVAYFGDNTTSQSSNTALKGFSISGVAACYPPVANAGTDQTVNELAPVTLDGSGSSDLDGDPLTYTWVQLAGTPVTLNLSDSVHPTFTAPNVPRGGETLTFQLTVSDGCLTSDDSVNITVKDVNHPPVADAGVDQTVQEGSPLTLDGSNSYDPDSDSLTFSWVQTAGTMVTLSDPASAQTSFTAPLVGQAGEILAFELTVSDGLSYGTDTVDVIVENVNHCPTANAGDDQTRDEGSQVTLNATESSDPDSDTLAYTWTQASGIPVTLSDSHSPDPTFVAPPVSQRTDLVFRLVVNDGLCNSEYDEVTITILDINGLPACDLAQASPSLIWPPNHKLVEVGITGVTDPNNNQVTITITGVTQDEPVDGLGDGDTSPDAVIQGDKVLLRAERSGNGNGRVYRITFTADDGDGGNCTGTVNVCVPQSSQSECIDDGQHYNSLP